MIYDVPFYTDVVPDTRPPCIVCGRDREGFPQCFLGDPTCSVNCQKRWEEGP